MSGSHDGGGAALLEPRAPRTGSGGPPPDSGGGDEGHGGSGGNGDGDLPEDADPEWQPYRGPGSAELALRLTSVAIVSLFLIFTAVFVHLRNTAPQWPPPDLPAAPRSLMLSTLFLALSSTLLVRAAVAQGDGQRGKQARWLAGTLAAGLGFLTSQAVIWWRLIESDLLPSSGRAVALFYIFTGLHAVHVLAGLAYLTHLWFRARSPRAPRPTPNNLRLVGIYWHLMGLIWVVLLTLLWFPV